MTGLRFKQTKSQKEGEEGGDMDNGESETRLALQRTLKKVHAIGRRNSVFCFVFLFLFWMLLSLPPSLSLSRRVRSRGYDGNIDVGSVRKESSGKGLHVIWNAICDKYGIISVH